MHHDQNEIDTDHPRRLPRSAPHQPGRDALRLSWGTKGYNEYWLNETNAWIYATCTWPASAWSSWPAFPRAEGARARALKQAARELMLAQTSDWAFIMSTGTTVPYATRRINDHVISLPACTTISAGRGRRAVALRPRGAGQYLPGYRLPPLRHVKHRRPSATCRRSRSSSSVGVRSVLQDRRAGRRAWARCPRRSPSAASTRAW